MDTSLDLQEQFDQQVAMISQLKLMIREREEVIESKDSEAEIRFHELHAQLVYKDKRIVDLSEELQNALLANESLKEQLAEKDELIECKVKAFQLIRDENEATLLKERSDHETNLAASEKYYLDLLGDRESELNALRDTIKKQQEELTMRDKDMLELIQRREQATEKAYEESSSNSNQFLEEQLRDTTGVLSSKIEALRLLQEELYKKDAAIHQLQNQFRESEEKLRISFKDTDNEKRELESQLANIQKEFDSLKKDFSAEKKKHLSSKAKAKSLEKQLAKLNNTELTPPTTNEDAKKYKELNESYNASLKRIQELEDALQSTQEQQIECQRLCQDLATQEADNVELKEENVMKDSIISGLNVLVEELRHTEEALRNALTSANTELDELKCDEEQSLEKFRRLKDELIEWKEKCQQLDREMLAVKQSNEILTAQLDKLQKEFIDKKTNYETQILERDETIGHMTAKLEIIQKDFESKSSDLGVQIETYATDNANLIQELENIQKELLSLKTTADKISQLNELVKRKDLLIDELKLEIENQHSMMDTLNAKLQHSQQTCEQLTKEKSQLQDEYSISKVTLNQMNVNLAEKDEVIKNLEAQVQSHNDLIVMKESEIQSINVVAENLQCASSTERHENEKLFGKIQELQELLSKVEKENQEKLEEYEQQIVTLTEDLRIMNESCSNHHLPCIEQLTIQSNHFESQLKEAKEDLSKIENERQELSVDLSLKLELVEQLRGELANLRTDNDKLTDEVKEFSATGQDIAALQETCHAYEQESKSLKTEKLNAEEVSVASHQEKDKTISDLKSKLEQCHCDLNQSQLDLADIQSRIAEFQSNLCQKEEELSEKDNLLLETKRMLGEYADQVKVLNDRVEELSDYLNNRDAELESLRTIHTTQNKESEDLKLTLEEREQKLASLISTNQSWSETNSELERTCSAYEEKLQTCHVDIQMKEVEISEKSSLIQSLSNEIDLKNLSLTDFETKYSALSEENSLLTDQVSKLEKDIDQMKQDLIQHEKIGSGHKQQLELLVNEKQNLEEKCFQYENQISQWETKLMSDSDSVELLQQNMRRKDEELESKENHVNQLINQVEKLTSVFNETHNECESLKEKLNETENFYKAEEISFREKEKELSQSLLELQEREEVLSHKLQDTLSDKEKEALEIVEKLSNEKFQLTESWKTKCESLDQKLTELSADYDSLVTEKNSLENLSLTKINQLEEQREELNGINESLNHQVQSLKSMIHEFEQNEEIHKSASQELEMLHSKYSTLLVKEKSLTEENSQLKESLSDLKEESSALHVKISELENLNLQLNASIQSQSPVREESGLQRSADSYVPKTDYETLQLKMARIVKKCRQLQDLKKSQDQEIQALKENEEKSKADLTVFVSEALKEVGLPSVSITSDNVLQIFKEKLFELKANADSCKSEICLLNEKIESYTSTMERLQTAVAKSQLIEEELEMKNQIIDKLQADLTSLAHKYSSEADFAGQEMQREKDELISQLDAHKIKIDELQSTLQLKDNELLNLSEDFAKEKSGVILSFNQQLLDWEEAYNSKLNEMETMRITFNAMKKDLVDASEQTLDVTVTNEEHNKLKLRYAKLLKKYKLMEKDGQENAKCIEDKSSNTVDDHFMSESLKEALVTLVRLHITDFSSLSNVELIDSLRSVIEQKENAAQEVLTELQVKESTLLSLSQSESQLKEENFNLSSHLKELRQIALHEAEGDYNEEMSNEKVIGEELKLRQEKLWDTLQSLDDTIADKDNLNSTMETIIGQLEQACDTEVQQLSSTNQLLKMELNKINEENAKLIEENKKTLSDLISAKDELNQINQNTSQTSSEQLTTDLSDLMEDNKNLRELNEALRETVSEKEDHITDSMTYMENLKKTIADLERQREILQENLQTANNKLSACDTELQGANRLIEQLQSDLSDKEARLAETRIATREDYSFYVKSKSPEETKVDASTDLNEQVMKSESLINELEAAIVEKDNRINFLEKEAAEVNAQIENQVAMIKSMESRLETSSSNMKALMEFYKGEVEMTDMIEKINEFYEQYEECEEERTALENKLQKAVAYINKLKRRNKDRENNLIKLKEDLEAKTLANEDLSSELNSAYERIAHFESIRPILLPACVQTDCLSFDRAVNTDCANEFFENFELQRSRLQKTLQKLEIDNDMLTTQLSESIKKNESLEQQVETFTATLNDYIALNSSLTDQLKESENWKLEADRLLTSEGAMKEEISYLKQVTENFREENESLRSTTTSPTTSTQVDYFPVKVDASCSAVSVEWEQLQTQNIALIEELGIARKAFEDVRMQNMHLQHCLMSARQSASGSHSPRPRLKTTESSQRSISPNSGSERSLSPPPCNSPRDTQSGETVDPESQQQKLKVLNQQLNRMKIQMDQLRAERNRIHEEYMRIRKAKDEADLEISRLSVERETTLNSSLPSDSGFLHSDCHNTEVEKKLNSLESEATIAKTKMLELEQENEKLRYRQNVLETKCKKMEFKLKALRSKFDNLTIRLDDKDTEMDSTVDHIRRNLTVYERERAKWMREISHLKSTLDTRTEQLANLERKIKEGFSSDDFLRSQIEEIKRLKETLQTMKEERDTEVQRLQGQNDELEADARQLKLKLASLQKSRGNTDLETSGNSAPLPGNLEGCMNCRKLSQIIEKQADENTTRRETDMLRERLSQKDKELNDFSNALDQLRQSNLELCEELSMLKQGLTTDCNNCAKLGDELEEIRERFSCMEIQLSSSKEELNQMTCELSESHRELEKKNEEMRKLHSDLLSVQEDNRGYCLRMEDMGREKEELAGEISHLTEQLNEHQIDRQCDSCTNLQSELKESHENCAIVKEKFVLCDEELKRVTQELSLSNEELEQKKQFLTDLEGEIVKLKDEMETNASKLETKNKELNDYCLEKAEYELQMDSLKKTMLEKEESLMNLQKEFQSAQMENQTMRKTIEELRAQLHDETLSRAAISSFTPPIEEMKTQRSSGLCSQCEQNSELISKLQNDIIHLNERNEKLNEDLMDLSPDIPVCVTNDSQLKQLQDELEASRGKISELTDWMSDINRENGDLRIKLDSASKKSALDDWGDWTSSPDLHEECGNCSELNQLLENKEMELIQLKSNCEMLESKLDSSISSSRDQVTDCSECSRLKTLVCDREATMDELSQKYDQSVEEAFNLENARLDLQMKLDTVVTEHLAEISKLNNKIETLTAEKVDLTAELLSKRENTQHADTLFTHSAAQTSSFLDDLEKENQQLNTNLANLNKENSDLKSNMLEERGRLTETINSLGSELDQYRLTASHHYPYKEDMKHVSAPDLSALDSTDFPRSNQELEELRNNIIDLTRRMEEERARFKSQRSTLQQEIEELQTFSKTSNCEYISLREKLQYSEEQRLEVLAEKNQLVEAHKALNESNQNVLQQLNSVHQKYEILASEYQICQGEYSQLLKLNSVNQDVNQQLDHLKSELQEALQLTHQKDIHCRQLSQRVDRLTEEKSHLERQLHSHYQQRHLSTPQIPNEEVISEMESPIHSSIAPRNHSQLQLNSFESSQVNSDWVFRDSQSQSEILPQDSTIASQEDTVDESDIIDIRIPMESAPLLSRVNSNYLQRFVSRLMVSLRHSALINLRSQPRLNVKSVLYLYLLLLHLFLIHCIVV